MRSHSSCIIKKDNPPTDNKIKIVSQIEAVILAGNARMSDGCVAPCVKIKTFCTPNGKIRPNAKINPCIIVSNSLTPFPFTLSQAILVENDQLVGYLPNQFERRP